MISVRYQGKPFSITVIQVQTVPNSSNITVPNSNAEEAEAEWFYEDLQDLLELTPKKMSFHHRGLECKSRKNTIKETLAEDRSQKHVSKFLSNLCLISGLYCEGEIL